jgi:hypothetical protein
VDSVKDMGKVYIGCACQVALSDLLHKVNALVQLSACWFIVAGFASISAQHLFSPPSHEYSIRSDTPGCRRGSG